MPRLRRSRTTTPGIRRIRRGRGFAYLDPRIVDRYEHGETITPRSRSIEAALIRLLTAD